MNLILLFEQDFVGQDRVSIEGRRARHIYEIHRARAGDKLSVGMINGLIGIGSVVSSSVNEVVLEVNLAAAPPSPSQVDVLLAMPRPKILRRVLQAICSIGVKRLILLNSFRVEKSYFDSPLLDPQAITEQLLLGLEQAKDTVLPEVLVRPLFKPFVQDEVDLLWKGAKRLLAHPTSESTVLSCDTGSIDDRAVVAIGPEGGWIPYEVSLLEQSGFQSFNIGERILRVDTAVTYVLAQVALARVVNKHRSAP